MGVSITRIVKFIRKGKGVIIAQSPTVWSYTETQWKNYYCTNGRSLTWKPISNVSDFTVGDTMVINGVVSDKGNITISLYAKVVSIDVANQSITAQSQNYIISGEDGKDAVSIYVDPPTIVHKKATTKTTYSIDFKVKDGANYVTGVSTNSVFTCSLQTTLPSGISYSYKVLQNDRISCVFVVDANAVVNVDLSFKVTYKGIDYNCTVPFKTVADGQTGGKGDRGPALRGPQMWDDCAVGYVFQQGADGEDFKDVVMYNNNYYSCIMTHAKETGETTSDGTLTAKYWKLADKFEIIATKILLAQYALVKNLGVEVIDMKDSAGNVIFQAMNGDVICNSGTFNNITVKGNSTLEGIVKAQLYYSPTKQITTSSNREYTINPQTEPCCSFLINEPTNTRFVTLPKASLYDGLEIQIFTKVLSGAWDISKMTFAKSNGSDSLFVRANAYNIDFSTTTKRWGASVNNYAAEYKDYKDSSIYMCPNCVCKFKSINGAWYAIEGLYTGE